MHCLEIGQIKTYNTFQDTLRVSMCFAIAHTVFLGEAGLSII